MQDFGHTIKKGHPFYKGNEKIGITECWGTIVAPEQRQRPLMRMENYTAYTQKKIQNPVTSKRRAATVRKCIQTLENR